LNVDAGLKEGEWYTSGEIFKEILRISRFAALGVAVLELGRNKGRDKKLCLVVKYWLRIL
jgi:hypothetical protein